MVREPVKEKSVENSALGSDPPLTTESVENFQKKILNKKDMVQNGLKCILNTPLYLSKHLATYSLFHSIEKH